MAKQPPPKLTKAQLLKEIDQKLNDLNLLRSALAADKDHSKGKLEEYKANFEKLFEK